MRLYYYPGNASLAPHIVLVELGIDHGLVLVDRGKEAQKSAEYLAINPHGKIPTLQDGGIVIHESAAICLYLAEKFPHTLQPETSAERAQMLQWLFFLTNTVQPTLMRFHYPEQLSDDPATQAALSEHAQARATEQFGQIEAVLGSRPWLAGEHITVSDVFLFMLARWARMFDAPPRDLPSLGDLLTRMLERPAVQHVLRTEQLETPYV